MRARVIIVLILVVALLPNVVINASQSAVGAFLDTAQSILQNAQDGATASGSGSGDSDG